MTIQLLIIVVFNTAENGEYLDEFEFDSTAHITS